MPAMLRSFCFLLVVMNAASALHAAELRAGVARVDITDRTAGPVNDPLFAKALVLKSDETTAVLITIDAVAIGEIGRIKNEFLPRVRKRLELETGITPANVVINASHCHGIVRADLEDLVIKAVKEAAQGLVPVRSGTATSSESRISENRRLKMKDGSEIDMRRAYSLPRDNEIAAVGPIDPQVGVLRLDRLDGQPLAVLYTFACHPIMNPPSKGNSADYPGFASKAIEESLGGGAVAFFVQGCGGDINPVRYKEVTRPADAEPLGNMLGLCVLRTSRQIATTPNSKLAIKNETISLPRGADLEKRIACIEAEQVQLVAALKPTNINFKSFLPLLIQEKLAPDFPSHHAQSYLHDQMLKREALAQLDADNRQSVQAYLENIDVMERMTRLNTNLALLKMHLAQNKAAAKPTIDAEITALCIGDFKLVTFPGELTVQVGLNIKKAAGEPNAFVAGYTNGYIYYTPTVEQRNNTGFAQEDCDCIVAPEWQHVFESKAIALLKSL